jgi:hypothetical protein
MSWSEVVTGRLLTHDLDGVLIIQRRSRLSAGFDDIAADWSMTFVDRRRYHDGALISTWSAHACASPQS